MSTDHEWEKWGHQDPYFGVITDPRFRRSEMTAAAKQDFFLSGHVHVDHVLTACRKYIDPVFVPQRVLDFGCGVGRLALPFASIAKEVVGADVSEPMLAEARRNCAEQSLANVSFVKSDDTLSGVSGLFDLVHSAIVLQHIDTERGTRLVAQLLARLSRGGIGALQVTYAKAYHPHTLGAVPPPPPPQPPEPRLMVVTKSQPWLRKLFGRSVATDTTTASYTGAQEKASEACASPKDPEMLMNSYDLNQLFFLMQTAGVSDFHTEFTDHGGELGVFLYFQKQ